MITLVVPLPICSKLLEGRIIENLTEAIIEIVTS